MSRSSSTPDAVVEWVDRLPPGPAAYARLARIDRPAGIWLLFWPCIVGLALSGSTDVLRWFLLFLAGSVAMRAAGCVYNDIIDRDYDRQVARTAARPIASGAISVASGWRFLVALSLVGFLVLLHLPRLAQLIALASLALVAAYPFMKRITWWPQAWLGLTFNWGLWVGWALSGERADLAVAFLAYAGLVAWTLGYDTIYAAQDQEDDALAGVKSSARALGGGMLGGVGLFFAATIALLSAAIWLWTGSALAIAGLLPAALHLGWQVRSWKPGDAMNSLARFRSNATAGALMAAGFLAAPLLAML